MPSSLRFMLVLSALALATGLTSIVVLRQQDVRAARINAEQMTRGNVERGKAAFRRFGCGSCHEAGLGSGATGQVGPPLTGIASRALIAGKLPNTPDRMIFWIRHPQQVVPGNGMPDQGIGEADARDLAAYLYTLRPSAQ